MQLIAASQQFLHPLLALGADDSMPHSAVMACISPHAPLVLCAHSCLFQSLSHHTQCAGDHFGRGSWAHGTDRRSVGLIKEDQSELFTPFCYIILHSEYKSSSCNDTLRALSTAVCVLGEFNSIACSPSSNATQHLGSVKADRDWPEIGQLFIMQTTAWPCADASITASGLPACGLGLDLLQVERGKSLKLIIMSATLDAAAFARYFGGTKTVYIQVTTPCNSHSAHAPVNPRHNNAQDKDGAAHKITCLPLAQQAFRFTQILSIPS